MLEIGEAPDKTIHDFRLDNVTQILIPKQGILVGKVEARLCNFVRRNKPNPTPSQKKHSA